MDNYDQIQLRILEKQVIECSDIEEILSDYIDNEIISSLKARVANHILNCECCTEAQDDLMTIMAVAKSLHDAPMPSGVRERLRKNLNARLNLNLSDI
ncbi:MAG: hypothetical protein SGJ02_02845 [bacterium]|nr:hypothetical protein [bacterium]